MKNFLVLTFLFGVALSVDAQQLPDFYLNDIQNNPQSFEDLKGDQVTLFDFWATWCKPCQKAIPELNKVYEEYKERGVQVVGINCDGPRSIAKVAPMAKALKIQYPVLLDINSDLMNNLNLTNFPTLIAVNTKGTIVYVHEGFAFGDEL